MSAEQEILRTINLYEGGYSNDPDDPGGETKYGISKRYHQEVDIANLTKEAAAEIGKREYYDKLHLSLLNSPRIRWKLFDLGFGPLGPYSAEQAIKWVQLKCAVKDDGVLGPITAAAINSSPYHDAILFRISEYEAREFAERCIEAPVKLKYLRGWLKRAFDVAEDLEASLK